jgi:hypothetical protein
MGIQRATTRYYKIFKYIYMDLSKGCLSYLGSLEVALTNDFYVA